MEHVEPIGRNKGTVCFVPDMEPGADMGCLVILAEPLIRFYPETNAQRDEYKEEVGLKPRFPTNFMLGH